VEVSDAADSSELRWRCPRSRRPSNTIDQIKRLLESLNWKQILSLVLATAAVIGGLVAFSRWNRERDFRPLYSALTPEDAAAVLAKVRENGSEFRVSDDGSVVLAPSERVAELRLVMVEAGLPKSGRIGFDRALEGELERSVMSLAEVEQARVHITFSQPAKASVLVKLRPGAQLTPQNVAGICQLAASAVDGLLPEAVSVLDMRGNLLNRAALDCRQKLEHEVLAKIDNTLEPLLGADKFRATASIECEFTSADRNGETYDPPKSVMVSSQKTEDPSGESASAAAPGDTSSPGRPVLRRSVRHVQEPEGTVKRMSVSLLLDSVVRYEGTGAKAKRIVEAPSADKLKAIHNLVAGVIGLSPERGDQLVVETLPFESTLNPEQLRLSNPAPLPALGLGAGAALLLAPLFILWRVVRKKGPGGPADLPPELPAQKQDACALNPLKLPPVTKKTAVLAKHISEQARIDSAGMANVLRAWMAEPGDEAKRSSNSTPHVPGIRKAAILMIILGDQVTADILRQMDEEEVQMIGHEVARITSISDDQAERILEEFYQMSMAHESVLKGGIDYAKKMVMSAFPPEHARKLVDRLEKTLGSELANFDPRQLAGFIHNEHPQTIALILSQLNPSQAAGLLISLPQELRADVALRMAHLDQISPLIVSRIAAIIGQRLKSLGEPSRESYGGVRAVSEMFNRLDAGSSQEILEAIEEHDPQLVETIRRMMFVFEDLLLLSQEAIQDMLGKVDRKMLTIALKGTSDQLKNHILQLMSQRGADLLKEDLESLGPIKLTEVEAAQQQIIAVIRQLEAEGTISLKGTVEEQYVV
jgi:flagellar motor switch protein FliG